MVREPHARGPVVGRFLVGAADPAVPVVDGGSGQVAVAEPDAGLPLPLGTEPADLMQLRGGNFPGQQAEHATGLDGAELGSVAGGDDPRPGLPGGLGDHGQVSGAELAGLIQHQDVVPMQRHGPAQLVGAFDLAEELGDVVALGQALVLQHPGRVSGGGQADDPVPGERGPQPGELGHRVALARASRGHQHRRGGGRGEHRDHRVTLLGAEIRTRGRGLCLLLADELRHRPFGGGEDLLFGVQVGQGAVAFGVRRPVDAAAVGGADAEAGHVGDVRRGDLDDLGPGAAGDGQLGYLGDHRLAVGARGQHGERPVHLEPELCHRPHRVMGLHLGDRDPRGRALGRIIQHRRCGSGVRGGEGRDLAVHRRQRGQFAVHGLGFPGSKPLRRSRLRRTGLPGQRAAGIGLGAAGVLPGLLVQQPQRAPGRRRAVHRLVLPGKTVEFAGDGDGAGAEQVHDVLGDPADLGAVAVGPGHHDIAERGQPGLQAPVRDRGHAEPLAVQGPGIQGPPRVVGSVGALDAVPDRDVHVQLRVTIAGEMVQEQAGDQAAAVPPLPRPHGMVPGPGVGGMAVEPAHRLPRRFQQRVLQLIGPGVERGGLVVLAAVAGLPCGDAVGDVQQGDALDRADGQVEIWHLMRLPAAFGRADPGQLGRAGVRVRGQPGGHRCIFPLADRLGLATPDQQLPARADVVLVQAADHGRVDLPAQPERRGAFPGPLAGRFPGRGVVGHGPGAAAAALPGGEIGDVVARVQRHICGHDPSPPASVSAFIVRDACVRLVLSTHGRYVRAMHNLRIYRAATDQPALQRFASRTGTDLAR